MTAGDVIAEVDHQERFVDLWLVVMVEVHAVHGIRPFKVRRACRPRAAVEMWTGRAWRESSVAHNWALPVPL
jgi:hypothetical protein